MKGQSSILHTICSDADSISVYILINGKTEVLNTWCGRKLPPMLMSNQHTMIVEFQSLHSSKFVTGFKAYYSFVTNFGIHEGQQDNRGMCVFNYQSAVKTSGEFTSPNYNGLYPRNTECHYLFYGKERERVQIKFLDFDVDGLTPRCEESTNSDYVSFSNFAESEDRKMTRLCGSAPAEKREIWSDGPFFRVIFKSNEMYDSTGFQAIYQFKGLIDEEQDSPYRQHDNAPKEHKRDSGNSVNNSSRRKSLIPYLSFLNVLFILISIK
ncbi:suppressor of los1-1 [Bulinus truncatus]|nr:suppressor of los1-1 [Bulinus truncatus]